MEQIKTNQIKSLMRKYSRIVIVSFSGFLLVIFVQALISSHISAKIRMEQMTKMVYDRFYTDYQIVTDISHNVVDSQAKINNYTNLFDLTYSEFHSEFLMNNDGEIPFLPRMFENYLRVNENIQMIVIQHVDRDGFYTLNKSISKGFVVKEYPKTQTRYKIEKDLINTFDFSVIGKITVHLNSDEFENIEQLLDESVAFNTIILDGKNNLMFSAKEDALFDEYSGLKDNQKSFEKYLEDNKYSYSLIRGTGDNKFITYVPSYKLFFMISKASYIWLGMAILLVIILLKSFKLLFQNYEAQVDDVVESLTSININTINERIPLENKEGEFLLISQTTNAMLDNMNKYIEEILVLELRQKEAELSALQAQINPHFMYNTLEYIRMNVLSEGLKDLSQVVFTFASLLRNNISSVKTIPLQKEIDFCEKYVFLYQIRHPEHIAYSFNIAREVQNKIVPRFILQPIVENYLIHGLDYDRNDNAISVEAYKEADLFVINIIDNGKGMSDEDLEKLQASILSGDQQLHKDSIGILNVSERLKYFYDGQATLSVFKNETGGITATITVKED